MMRNLSFLLLCGCWWYPITCTVAFVPTTTTTTTTTTSTTTRSTYKQQHHRQQRRRLGTVLQVIFTRLSDDCLYALETAQVQAQSLQQKQVDETFLLLGLCDKPGNTQSTLEHFKIRYKDVLRALKYLQRQEAQKLARLQDKTTTTSRKRAPKLSDFNKSKFNNNRNDAIVELPYSTTLQAVLYQAGKIAQTMGSSAIQTEHVFLALLEYQELENGETTAASRDGNNAAMELIWHIDAMLEGEDICLYLLEKLLAIQTRPQLATPPDQVLLVKKSGKDNKSDDSKGQQRAAPYESTGAINDKDKEKDKEQTFLEQCGTDLTQQARDGELDVVSGRSDEIQNCLRILARRRKNNICLIGEAGVGKTAIAEGLAQLLSNEDECPVILKGKKIISLEVAALLAGTKFRGEFEERFRSVIEEVTNANGDLPSNTILFLDEIHTLVGAGATEGGGMDAANLLKPYLARGRLQLIGATTISEYNRFIAKDPALERRLQPVLIKEPSVNQTIGILKALLPFYTQHHRVEFTDESVEMAAKLSDRYINDRFLPDKAIDVLDEAGALATLKRVPNEPPPIVTEKLITNVISEWSNIPVGKLEMDEMSRLKSLEANLANRVKGQERAVRSVAKAIRRARTGIRNPRRPISSFLFCGPTGTGKTELCKTLAETYFGSERDLIRIDCSEYMERHTVSRLTGPPPGYAGYEEGGQLTEAVRRAPHSVVLFDEMEKAHPDVLNLLLQVMEDGILTDGKGRTVNFKNTVLIMTSNVGSRRVLDLVQEHEAKYANDQERVNPQLTTTRETELYAKLSRAVKGELEAKMRPEFLNRIDDIVVFKPLTENELALIAAMMVLEIAARAKYERNVDITISGDLLRQMVKEGEAAASRFGARPLRRAVQRILEDAISEGVVLGFLEDADRATFDLQESHEPAIPFYVTITRARDGETISIEMEESNRDSLSDPVPTDVKEGTNGEAFNGSDSEDQSLPALLN